MNGVHDMGGQHCHGPVIVEGDESLFHHEWERRVLALALACGATGTWNLDQSRFSRESLPPDLYLSSSYYKIWLEALERMLVSKGLLSDQELANGKMELPAKDVKQVLRAENVTAALQKGSSVGREASSAARFAVGDRVYVRNYQPQTHTRLPAYIRQQTGTIAEVHGCHIFPDSHAQGQGEDARWLYCVEFAASDLWGDTDSSNKTTDQPASTGNTVMVDCWEPYLDALADTPAG